MNAINTFVAAVPMPARISRLPVSDRGYPIPWFVAWIDGQPDFRVVDTPKIGIAWKRRCCWICGETLGRNVAFLLGPMCAVNRTISEPPSHLECAEFSVRACPFLANPRMRRNEADMPSDTVQSPGVGLKRNPGATGLWVTRGYRPFRAPGGVLWTFDDPIAVTWWREGRRASREEVVESIRTGLPALQQIAAEEGPRALAALQHALFKAERHLPAAEAS